MDITIDEMFRRLLIQMQKDTALSENEKEILMHRKVHFFLQKNITFEENRIYFYNKVYAIFKARIIRTSKYYYCSHF